VGSTCFVPGSAAKGHITFFPNAHVRFAALLQKPSHHEGLKICGRKLHETFCRDVQLQKLVSPMKNYFDYE